MGCHNCNNTGYKGRIAVHEILEIDNEIRRMISSKVKVEDIYDYVLRNGKVKFIKDNIVELIRDEQTTIEELLRQTSLTIDI